MSRLTVFSLCAALGGAFVVSPGLRAENAAPPAALDEDAMADAIETTVARVFEQSAPAVVRVESNDELGKVAGTGFFADATGLIYTLSSVVGDGISITVTRGDKRLPARLLTKDPRSGLALIKIDDSGATPFLPVGNCRALKVASPLVVVGFPFDHDAAPSFGVIGGFDRQSNGKFFTTTHIRANIPVQRGQGGSPVLNLDGEAVGILVSGFEDDDGCYVLPMRAAEKARNDYERFGDVRHGWAGVTVEEMPVAIRGSRMAIDVVDQSGPAAQGFRTGDVILQVGAIEIREPEDTLDASFFLTAGEPVDVRVARGDEILTIPLTPGEHPLERKSELQALGPGSLIAPAPPATP
ncbi:MAG: serine protease [Chthoniobacterales bacterium]|nr:serine protease [Chthoniobacterales bacterium]